VPGRPDLRTILVLGSGPDAIGQAAELDHSGIQTCRALSEDGYDVVLVSPNPAAVMTDPRMAARTCPEPLTRESVAGIIERERPDALLATLGGPGALSLALALAEDGTLARFDVELLGAPFERLERDQDPVTGWKKLELGIVRDAADHVVVVCAIESLDPVGVHAGDSIAVTPAQTLSDADDARVRAIAVALVRELGVVGGASVELALSPRDGRAVVIAAHPLTGRGAALAARSTGFPIAGVLARLAVGFTLDELPDGATGQTLAAFEPPRDHCVVKIPRWAFESFPDADPTLTARMQSVGEAMAIGRSFGEALQKAVRSLARGTGALTLGRSVDERELARLLETPTPERLWAIAEAYRTGWSTADVQSRTRIDPWFLDHVRAIVELEAVIAARALDDMGVLNLAKRRGFPDARIAELAGGTEHTVRALRLRNGITPAFRALGTRAGTLYSTYDDEDQAPPAPRRTVVVLGAGPTRIGHGVELDDCCVQAAAALRARGLDAVVVNCNPAAASTDDDASDRLYVEPLTLEDVLNVADRERPLGVIVQLGGQVPQALAAPLAQAGVAILGTPVDAIDCAEDPWRLRALVADLGLVRAAGARARSLAEASDIAARLGYPVLVRTSGGPAGRAVRIVHDDAQLQTVHATSEHPVLIETFLEDAIEVDVDAVSDGRQVFVAGVMEHIERAGIHSGDAACALPPYSIGPGQVEQLHRQMEALACGLGVVGLLNVRFALKNDVVYAVEVSPCASRTVSFVSRAVGVPLARLATDVVLGDPLPSITPLPSSHVAVKEAVFPFSAFAGVDVVLGPEMRSTGTVMAIASDFREAYLKSQLAAGVRLPASGKIWISARSRDRRTLVMLAERLGELGFGVVAAGDTARVLRRHGMAVETLPAGGDERPRVLDLMRGGQIALAIDIPEDGHARARSAAARQEALRLNIPYYTTLDGAQAVIGALEILLKREGSQNSPSLLNAA
jgi:carbamoyl-phosphate synthase large subunit